MKPIEERIDTLANAPVLLVACDYDGTLAPIVNDPSQAEPNREALVALRSLAALPNTHVAIISGRALGDLAARTQAGHAFHLVGSHGSEFEAGFAVKLDPQTQALRDRLGAALRQIAQGDSGFLVEEKPTAFAFHYRRADEKRAEEAVRLIHDGPANWDGVHVRHGKKVVELSVIETNKGLALQRVRHAVGASVALFLGDDLTDEDAFATLSGPDVGIKVGPGASRAAYRVEDTTEVARLLARLAMVRSDWVRGATAVPIEQLSLLSDQRTAALVDPNGRMVWLCLPRLDSSAFFAELLGGPTAGFFEVCGPHGTRPMRQRYVGDSFVLETHWPQFTVTDYLDCSGGRAYQRAGRTDLVRVIQGRGWVRVAFAPRLDFGRVHTRLSIEEDGLVVAEAPDPVVLRSPGVKWRIEREGVHENAVAEFQLGGKPLILELRQGTGNLGPSIVPEAQRRRQTEKFWSGWAETLTIPPLEPELVRRSALVIKAMCYGSSGAIAAAATTSLPELVGGVRNWDYRYCWPRDAAMAAATLVRLGSTGHAMKFLDWMLDVLERRESGDRLRPVYTVSGGHLGPEAEIGELPGYMASRPVRIGNLAAQQVQLDVFGPVAELVALLAERGEPLSSEHWRVVQQMVAGVAARWQEPDHGIWEARVPRKHHVHSKVTCWQTVDRAIKIAGFLGRSRPDWAGLRDQIAAEVLEQGWKPEINAFGTTYEDVVPDAATLCVGLSGLLAPDDPRFIGTVEWIERSLRDGPTVYRYRYDDGLPGLDGGFHLCTTWLIEALALIGRRDDAMKLFEQYVGLFGPTGLISEEYDPATGRALGNHPQVYSHLGLINAAVRLSG